MLFFIGVLFGLAGSKGYQEAHRTLPHKHAPLRVRFTAPKLNFTGLMEKIAEWNATVISKDESGTQPSIVSLLILFLFSGHSCVT